MSKPRRELSGEERKLWRRVASTVKPRRKLEPEDDHDAGREKPAFRPPAPAPPPRAQPIVKKASPPQARDREKRVRRGKVEIGASLDLHGHTQASGRMALIRFVHAAAARGDKTVIVITGVGRGGDGVLKRRLPEWLAEQELRTLVSGFAQAHRTHGGAGAFYVFLRSPKRSH